MTPKEVLAVISQVLGPDTIVKEYECSYEARLLVQKTMHLYQEVARRSDFDFSWYLAGPYSPELTGMICRRLIGDGLTRRYADEDTGLTDSSVKAVRALQALLEVNPDDLSRRQLSIPRWFELLASARCIDTRDAARNNGPLELETLADALRRAKW